MEEKILTTLIITAALMFIFSFVFSICAMLKEYKEIVQCRNMTINEIFQDKNCKNYWEVLVNEK